MMAVAVFVLLVFYRIGYGSIGLWLILGFVTLLISLLSGAANYFFPNDFVLLAARVAYLVGWSLLAVGFARFYFEADKSLP